MLPEYAWMDQTQCFDSAVFDSGWNALIRRLLVKMDGILAGSEAKLVVLQVKEKLGELRFYHRLQGASAQQEVAVSLAIREGQDESTRTCFECGAPGEIRSLSGWIIPLCDRHA